MGRQDADHVIKFVDHMTILVEYWFPLGLVLVMAIILDYTDLSSV